MTQPQDPSDQQPYDPSDQQPYDPAYRYPYDSAAAAAQYPYATPQYAPQYATQYSAYATPQYAAQYAPATPYAPGTWTPPGSAYPYGYPQPAPAAPRTSRRRVASLAAIAAAAVAAIIGVSAATGASNTVNGTGTAAQQAPVNPNSGNGGATFPGTLPNGSTPNGSGNGSGNSGNSGNGTTSTGQATSAQQVGIVDIYTKLKYQQAAAAGTGMVIDSSGYILTNNHVIDGSTSIKVIVVATGKSYTATVVGTAPTQDIAVLKLANASGMQTANLGDSDGIKVGDAVTGVGNAGGSGGTPSAAAGKIQSLNETITASDESGTDSEQLNGVIVTDAPIQSGDSGGPLFDKDNKVIGIDTAASTNGRTAGFAIPINKAMNIAKEIRTGVETTVIHIGYPAFLGVGVQNSQSSKGAVITNTEPGLPAAKSGIVAGDVVTALNGAAVTSADSLRAEIAKVNPGQTVSITYTDTSGTSHQTRVTLTTGPAD